MIYTGTATRKQLTPINMPLLDYFRTLKLNRYQVIELSKEQLNQIKLKQLRGFISGLMSEPIRNNDNLINRDAFILDLDDVVITESELLAYFERMKAKGKQFIAYPSISNGLKGVRYRLILPLDEPITDENTYKSCINFINGELLKNMIGKPDNSNGTWSQLMLLPCLTEYNTAEKIIIHDGEKWKLKAFINQAKENGYQEREKPTEWTEKPYTEYTGKYLSKLDEYMHLLAFGVQEGERNNTIARVVGYLFARDVNVHTIQKLVYNMNEAGGEPLPTEEVDNIIISVAKKHFKNYGG
ncbi:primase C-terminal domain-containing protein [Enterococcus cecorum]|uniref:Primase C-terminal 1 domain-containing protein n=1 Tax=Enterococcus cecorum TaxID=44008 RepID=A0A7X9NNB3_9ENTE|nr:primase C-terminal domain-containing protein [Enterococcus cecorum]NME50462.1 hypothetical protein [Enterococcus cecorum]